MNESNFQEILRNVDKRPITLIKMDIEKSSALKESVGNREYITLALRHNYFEKTRKNSICILELNYDNRANMTEYLLGVVTNKSAITTFETRVSINSLSKIYMSSFVDLSSKFKDEKIEKTFKTKLSSELEVINLTSATSKAAINALLEDKNNHYALNKASKILNISKSKDYIDLVQEDAENMALKIFGIDVNKKTRYESRLYEDNVIQTDLNNLEGFTKVAADYTGRVCYVKNQERLTIYHSNKLPLEKMLGVDLIYINETMGSIVMIQYKMLEKEYEDWVFRPDLQMTKEISRMKIPESSGSREGYRLNSNPFFFKFIKREAEGLGSSFVISLDHYQHYISTENAKGPRGGERIGFETLKRNYLTSSDIINLIRSGYVGTHVQETKAIKIIVDEVAKGNKEVIIAWQDKVEQS
ncbi:hypothetical protein [Psychrobacter fozii]|uniref:Uncharacterized protein n=1 Tax=Psychrobacter fozii TaxID=198480 RepID=A0A2V4VXK9_9GAMM|nr:hypothetical protein [Psychrobacter fozii]PYE40094.1 hypothetical protein DFP82_10253 [Psychrobacter fozii]